MKNNYDTFLIEKSSKKDWIKLFIYSLFLSIILRYFIIPIQIFSPGVAGLSQGISYLLTESFFKDASNSVYYSTLFYWPIYIFFNIPILIFSFKFYGKDFLGKSIFVFFVSFLFSLFLTYTPGFNNSYLINVDAIESLENESLKKTIKMIFFSVTSFFGGIIYGFAVGNIFKLDSSSLGFDPIARYLSREKGMNITKTLFITSFIISFVFGISENYNQIYSWETFISNSFFNELIISSVVFLFTYSFVVGKIYNSNSKISLKIITKNGNKISNLLNKINYHRGHTIEEVHGGYKKEKYNILIMLLNEEEKKDVIKIINKIDKEALIYTDNVRIDSTGHEWNPVKFTDKNSKYKKNSLNINQEINNLDLNSK